MATNAKILSKVVVYDNVGFFLCYKKHSQAVQSRLIVQLHPPSAQNPQNKIDFALD